jgi:hypothetical protein
MSQEEKCHRFRPNRNVTFPWGMGRACPGAGQPSQAQAARALGPGVVEHQGGVSPSGTSGRLTAAGEPRSSE